MGNYIKCGKMNKNYFYILLAPLFDIMKTYLYGKNHNQSFKDLKLYNEEIQNKLSRHYIMHDFFNYLGTIGLSFYFFKIEISSSRAESSLRNSSGEKGKKGHIILIHHNEDGEDFKTNSSFFFCLLIIFTWILEEQLMKMHIDLLQDLDFWMIEILIISIFTSKMFNIEIFKHQMFAMVLNIIPCLFKVGSIYLSFIDNTSEQYNYTGKLPIYYITNSEVLIPLGIITYLILITFRSFVNSNIKWYMDLKYISLNKLLMYYGIMGAVVCLIIILITTFNQCQYIPNLSNEKKRTYYFSDYICKVKKNETSQIMIINDENYTNITNINNFINFINLNNTLDYNISYVNFSNVTYYFSNFFLYFEEFKGIEILKELSVIIFGMVTHFFSQFFSLLIIKYLTPVHIIFSIPIKYIIEKTLMFLNNIIQTHKFFETEDKYKHKKFYLDIGGDFISVLGFLIYLELIILKFSKYDYNIKENIARRSFGESYGINNNSGNNPNDGEEKSFESEEILPEDENEDNMDLLIKG